MTAVKEDLIEIQSLDPVEVVRTKVEDAYSKIHAPVLVDDTSLVLNAWNGLPGALIAWFLSSVGVQGLLDMATTVTDRSASVTAALGYADEKGIRVFVGTVHGTLATELRGDGGFGYDSIFVPAGSELTYAEMSREEKNRISHRRLAVQNLREGLGLSMILA